LQEQRVSAPDVVTVTVDGREVQVPKGTGLVETALAAGIEIPVFCYEPRLGAPVGACRMCLVEVEGIPKLQAGCTLTATDGMVVKTAQTSKLAADGQNSTLEFILVNHPLDCPVCDKGGECPLQDLTFRWGPPVTRNTFPKRTFEKPIPISPTIALDRERCILCYRCTRFSSDVSEDDQLVARERGSQSIIATFEDQPYRAPFSGNVIELCPVGALTSTQYRFEARPWEIQDVPTVCGLCPVGCNVEATTREGKVKRIGSRNHPEVDEGWLCDKGRFGFTHLRAGDRLVDPSRKVGVRRHETLSWDAALDEAEALLRAAGTNIVTALSGSETVEQAYALGKLLRQGLGAHVAVMPEDVSPALDAFRMPLSAIRDAELIVILGDDPVVERAPIVDLWIKAARRSGAEVVENEIGSPDGGVKRARDELGDRIRESERAILIWSGPGGSGGATIAGLAAELGLAEKPGSGAFHLPETANGRGVADGWAAAADRDEADPEPIELLIVSGDEAAANPDVRALADQAERVLAISMFRAVVGWADLVLPGTSYLERDGTYMNLEGRLQRLRRAVIPPCPDELAWIAKLADRFDVDLSPHSPMVFAELSKRCYGGIDYSTIGEVAELPKRAEAVAVPRTPKAPKRERGKGLRLVIYRPLFSGPAVERVPELQFQRPGSVIELSPDDAKKIGATAGSTVDVRSNGTSVELRALVNKKLLKGVARVPAEHAQGLGTHVEVST
jgi:NADH-quinone oxidoreductase subunit G